MWKEGIHQIGRVAPKGRKRVAVILEAGGTLKPAVILVKSLGRGHHARSQHPRISNLWLFTEKKAAIRKSNKQDKTNKQKKALLVFIFEKLTRN